VVRVHLPLQERTSMKRSLVALALFVLFILSAPAASTAKPTPKEALQSFHDLIGSWRGTGTPSGGTREQRDKGFWQETIAWQWQFKGSDVWLRADLDKGKWYSRLELRYLPKKELYQLKAWTAGKDELTFEGKLDKKRLTVTRDDARGKQTQQLIFSLLHANRYLYRLETKPADATSFTPVFQVGATKQGVAFAVEEEGPECIVSGGRGTMAVSYKGQTYYDCCSGCRDAIKEEPEKYIKEYEESKKKKKEKKSE
jgi:YHS domain-containing protein